MSAPTRLPPCGLLRTVGPQRLQRSVNNGHAIRNLPRGGAEMHLPVCGCEHAPPPEGLRSLGHLPPQEGRMDMRVRMRSVSRRLTVCAAADPFEDVATHFDGFLLSTPFIPLLLAGIGGIADWPFRRRCRTTGVPRPVFGPGKASRYPSEGTTSMQRGCWPTDASASYR